MVRAGECARSLVRPYAKIPRTDPERWLAKIARNRARDEAARTELLAESWRVLTIWECTIRGRGRWPGEELLVRINEWLNGPDAIGEMEGRWPRPQIVGLEP